MNCEGHDCGLKEHTKAECAVGGPFHGYMSFSQADRWIASALQRVEAEVSKGFADYRLDLVAQAIYDFVWNEFCDWYLEIAKVQIQSGDASQQRATRRTLIRTLETVLRLAHPIIPFITEALWQKVAPVAGRSGPSVSIAAYPVAQLERIDASAEADIARLKQLVDTCRNLRGEMGLSPSQRVPLLALANSPADATWLQGHAATVQALTKLSEVQVYTQESEWSAAAQNAAVAVTDGLRLCLHVEIDVAAEKARLSKEVARLQNEITKAQGKLSNQAFVAKAPPAVIDQEKKRLADFTDTLTQVQSQLSRLG